MGTSQTILQQLNEKLNTRYYKDHNTDVLGLHSTAEYTNYLIAPVYHENEDDLRFILNVTVTNEEFTHTVSIIAQDTDDNAILNSTALGDEKSVLYGIGKAIWLP